MKHVEFYGTDCVIEKRQYGNGNTALQLYCADTGEPMATATVCIDEKLPKDVVVIKDYSENAGMLLALGKSGIIANVIKMVQIGWVQAPVVCLKKGWDEE